MHFQRGSALALLVLCGSFTVALGKPKQLAPGIIPIPDDTAPAPARPTTLRAPAASAIDPTAAAAVPRAAAAPRAALPAAAGAAAFPGYGAAAAVPTPAAGLGFPGMPGYGAAAPAAAVPGYGLPAANPYAGAGFPGAAAGFPGAAGAGFPGAFPGAGLPGGPVISVPPAGGMALPGAMPGAMPGLAGAFGPQLPPGLISPGLPAVPAPPPRARPAAPPAPPIPRGRQPWKPQWDELKDFTDNEVIVSFNVANTPEQIYWNQKKVRDALAKAAGILPNSISYYQVLPTTDDYGRPFTTIRFVVQNRNSDLAANLMTSLNAESTQTKLKNRIEELNLDLIGDSMKAQTPTDFKASVKGGASTTAALPSSTMMDTSGGMNGAGAANAAATGPGAGAGPGLAAGAGAGAGPGLAKGPGGLAAEPAGNATSTMGLPGMGAGGKPAMTRRQPTSGAVSTMVSSLLLPVVMVAGVLLL